ncbi:hypothetical protein C8F01DRAFT_1379461 [Mycena amicta]|nr:hypothetical protein C8F01DRAFT_1379461 [Mycena amicta]
MRHSSPRSPTTPRNHQLSRTMDNLLSAAHATRRRTHITRYQEDLEESSSRAPIEMVSPHIPQTPTHRRRPPLRCTPSRWCITISGHTTVGTIRRGRPRFVYSTHSEGDAWMDESQERGMYWFWLATGDVATFFGWQGVDYLCPVLAVILDHDLPPSIPPAAIATLDAQHATLLAIPARGLHKLFITGMSTGASSVDSLGVFRISPSPSSQSQAFPFTVPTEATSRRQLVCQRRDGVD